ncbi:hypothetical protein [Pseudomonas mosselii]|uniref:hypothetical protein n=1 Tax=Pseudomonas TaxID=286 RepID=UPI001F4495E2|nr:hypothetical protein [Pseudomonas mosselii]
MAKHLTKDDIRAIADTLLSWEGALNWELLCDKVAGLVGKRPTRQSLSSHLEIKRAFAQAKKTATEEVVRIPTPSSLKIAGDRIARLESEIQALKAENSQLLEKFLTWQYNASIAGLHESQLNRPLPLIDRERSDAPIRARPKVVRSKKS